MLLQAMILVWANQANQQSLHPDQFLERLSALFQIFLSKWLSRRLEAQWQGPPMRKAYLTLRKRSIGLISGIYLLSFGASVSIGHLRPILLTSLMKTSKMNGGLFQDLLASGFVAVSLAFYAAQLHWADPGSLALRSLISLVRLVSFAFWISYLFSVQ